jgi:hypothetical protein
MPWLDTTLRCKHCGTRLPDEKGDECPGCHAVLNEVGVLSELTEWAGTRRLGRTWFLWKHCFPIFVLIPVLASVLDCFLRGRWQPWYW